MVALILEEQESVFEEISAQCEKLGIGALWALDEPMMFEHLLTSPIRWVITRDDAPQVVPNYYILRNVQQVKASQINLKLSTQEPTKSCGS